MALNERSRSIGGTAWTRNPSHAYLSRRRLLEGNFTSNGADGT